MSKWKRNYDYATILRQTGKKKKGGQKQLLPNPKNPPEPKREAQ